MAAADPAGAYDYDVVVVGGGVGGHAAALHAVAKGQRTAIFTADDLGGTCVNRGCVPSKALLAASGRVRELRNAHHLAALGLSVSDVAYDREAVAGHAAGLASRVRENMGKSLAAVGVTVLTAKASLSGPNRITGSDGKTVTAGAIILAPGSVPFVPRGIEVDDKTVFTSDGALRLESVPEWVAIIGSGYIGLEFSDVYTALGSNVTFVEAMPEIMPGFDPEIARVAKRLLVTPRAIDFHTNVFATKVTPGVPGVTPVRIELTNATTKEVQEVLEVDAALVATGRVPFTDGLGLEGLGRGARPRLCARRRADAGVDPRRRRDAGRLGLLRRRREWQNDARARRVGAGGGSRGTRAQGRRCARGQSQCRAGGLLHPPGNCVRGPLRAGGQGGGGGGGF
eukprot:TRINITY_DN2847_c0_g1_i5.p1 TRINITY_DN2847_c0_g1~~TRINITY_DN2847_c0_g1_i5.p1  ORF type:complete len:454 (-),score=124.40 TRINITY_DN2847_c0_g1_i5:56-1246(-)